MVLTDDFPKFGCSLQFGILVIVQQQYCFNKHTCWDCFLISVFSWLVKWEVILVNTKIKSKKFIRRNNWTQKASFYVSLLVLLVLLLLLLLLLLFFFLRLLRLFSNPDIFWTGTFVPAPSFSEPVLPASILFAFKASRVELMLSNWFDIPENT